MERNKSQATEETYRPDATNDPLVGTQEHPDEMEEILMEPESEAAAWPTHGRAEKSRRIAGILGILFGELGVHRFYLSYMEVGLCQLAMFVLTFGAVIAFGAATHMAVKSMFLIALGTAAIVWLWGAVEGVMILLGMMPHDGHGHPLR